MILFHHFQSRITDGRRKNDICCNNGKWTLVLATNSAEDTVFAFNGETGEDISTFDVGKTPKDIKIRPDANTASGANESSGR